MAYERGNGGQLRTPHRIGILAAGWTGVIHVALWLGVVEPSPGPMSPLGISFLMAGITFFTGAYLVRANIRRRIVYLLGIPFTAGQILLWYVLNFDGIADMLSSAGAVGASDKIAQVILIATLTYLLSRD
ncbi:MAG: hypothetical protein J07HR59_01010 [Halorubrum sp. J07HR59]|nr:MAG: hypothetical protein J07HR59_01010 [Halorubrum sp. J07HR59]